MSVIYHESNKMADYTDWTAFVDWFVEDFESWANTNKFKIRVTDGFDSVVKDKTYNTGMEVIRNTMIHDGAIPISVEILFTDSNCHITIHTPEFLGGVTFTITERE